MKKYAIGDIEKSFIPPKNTKTASATIAKELDIVSDIPEDLTFDENFIYASVRAISARVNMNMDGFTKEELLGIITPGVDVPEDYKNLSPHNDKFGYRTFAGKNVHVDHQNQPEIDHGDDYTNAKHTPRGKILWAWYEEDDLNEEVKLGSTPDPVTKLAGKDVWVKLLMAHDRRKFPVLCRAIEDGIVTKVSMGAEVCFLPGTEITMSDGIQKNIESVSEGDEVLTHTGKSKSVYQTMVRDYKGLVYTFDTYGQSSSVTMTPEHPVWVKREEPSNSTKAKRLGITRTTSCTCAREFDSRSALAAHLREMKKQGLNQEHQPDNPELTNWIEAKDVRQGDWVLTPSSNEEGHPGSYPFARLLGYYLAEGNFCWDRSRYEDKPVGVEWNFSAHPDRDEIEFVEEVETLCDALGYKTVGPYIKENCYTVRVNSPEFAQKFLDYGGKYSWGKKIHSEVLRWSHNNQRALLEAYLNGDASFHNDYRHFESTTVSKNMADQLYLIAIKSGVKVTPPVKIHTKSAIEAGHREHYSMQGTLDPPENNKSGVVYSSGNRLKLDDSGIWRKVIGISIKEYEGKVYNFAVEEDESYVANDIAVHNCSSSCAVCGNVSAAPFNFCQHVRYGRGQPFPAEKTSYFVEQGVVREKDPILAFENNHGLQFFEESWILDIQADPTAVIMDLIKAEPGTSLKSISASKTAGKRDYKQIMLDLINSESEMKEKDLEKLATILDKNAANPSVNLNIDNIETLLDDKDNFTVDKNVSEQFDYSKPPHEQPGEYFPDGVFACSARVEASEANPEYPIDVDIDVDVCQGCMYNKSDKVGAVDCGFPEVVKEGGGDPLEPGFSDPNEDPDNSGLKNEDGTEIKEFPGLDHPPGRLSEEDNRVESSLSETKSIEDVGDGIWKFAEENDGEFYENNKGE